MDRVASLEWKKTHCGVAEIRLAAKESRRCKGVAAANANWRVDIFTREISGEESLSRWLEIETVRFYCVRSGSLGPPT